VALEVVVQVAGVNVIDIILSEYSLYGRIFKPINRRTHSVQAAGPGEGSGLAHEKAGIRLNSRLLL
jgi:hypothetical protein